MPEKRTHEYVAVIVKGHYQLTSIKYINFEYL